MVGSTVSHYRILEKLGGGGMGVVYKAQDLKLDRQVALKFLPPDLTRDPESKQRFIHEAKAASALQHNNICAIHDIDETEDQQLFICMEFYDGETVKKKIERGPLPIQESVDLAVQVVRGMAKAHQAGMVHRDIKPANVMVTKDGEVKIVDFGLARLVGQTRLTKAGSALGTTAYMSPEQVMGEESDHRADIWSLGVMLHEMITGQLPFKGEYDNVILYSILNSRPESLTSLRTGVPTELERIVNKCLEKDKNKRYQTAADLLADFHRLQFVPRSSPLEKGRTHVGNIKWYPNRYLSAGIVVLVIVLSALYFLKPWSTPTTPDDKSVAVLPFNNLSDSKEDEYFADGITEDIIMQLSTIADLKVISRTSVMQYKGISKNVRDIGEELEVGAVLEGSVRRAGNHVRIVAQLIDARNEGHLWADTYDTEMTEIFVIQSDVAQKIAGALKAKLLPAEREMIGKKQTENTEAYHLYLKGRFYWNKRKADDLKTAVEYFEQAIAKDSTYGLAYAGLASTYVVLPEYAGIPQHNVVPKANDAAKKALAIDATLAEAHAVRGLIKYNFEWDWPGAEKEFRRAIDLNPSYPTAHHWYNIYLNSLGRFDEALFEARRAQELDPLSLVINVNVGNVFYMKRQFEKAIEEYNKTLQLDQNYPLALLQLGKVYDAQGRVDEAIAQFQRVRAIVGEKPYGLYCLGHAYGRAGRKGEALKVIEELRKFSAQGYSMSYDIAYVYYGLGDDENTFRWLRTALQERHFLLVRMKTEPIWNGLRSDARFEGVLKNIGLLQ